jgi:hypothetical protein
MAITPPWALHVGAPDCFNRPAATGMPTAVTADDISVTFTALDGQVVNFGEYSTNATFTGTDRDNSGRTARDRGGVAGINIPHIANQLNSTPTCSAQGILTRQDITQPAAQTPKLAFQITGTATSGTLCDPAQSSPHRRTPLTLTEGSKNRRKHNEENQW